MPPLPYFPPAPSPTIRSSRRSAAARLWRRGLLVAALLVGPARAATPTEYEVKAAFLFNFTKFVEWPAASFAQPADPIIIAVLGRNPFGDGLASVVRDRTVEGRPIIVRVLASPEAARTAGVVHVLFVPAGEEQKFAALITQQPQRGVLTVGESERFSSLGGMVDFVVVESRVRFEINRAAAEAGGLKLRAQLQKLAAPRAAGRGSPP